VDLRTLVAVMTAAAVSVVSKSPQSHTDHSKAAVCCSSHASALCMMPLSKQRLISNPAAAFLQESCRSYCAVRGRSAELLS